MSKSILMMSSVPLVAPWNGADKNIARFLVNHDEANHFIVHSTPDTDWQHNRMQVIPATLPNAMPTLDRKFRSFAYLVRNAPNADIVHIVTSFGDPSRMSIEIMRLWRKFYNGWVIHTIPSLGNDDLLPAQFIADLTIVVSEYTRQKLQALGVNNVQRIYPPLSEADFVPSISPETVKQQHQLGDYAILYPAHYGKKSGISTMIASFSQIASQHPDAVLVFACRPHVGQDPQVEAEKVLSLAQQAGIAEQVRLLEVVEDMPALMRACSITALVPGYMASKMDLPLVILESLLIGNPAIVTDMPPMNEVLLGDCGFAVPYADISALANALHKLLSDSNMRQEIGKTGQMLVNRYCAPQHIIAQYHDFYARQ